MWGIITSQSAKINEDGFVSPVISGRMTVWPAVLKYILASQPVSWGILSDPLGNIVIPDLCLAGPILPLKPNIWLIGGVADMTLSTEQSHLINQKLLINLDRYWISKD
jgi:hypothetical protein